MLHDKCNLCFQKRLYFDLFAIEFITHFFSRHSMGVKSSHLTYKMCIPIFVALLSVHINHEHRDSAVLTSCQGRTNIYNYFTISDFLRFHNNWQFHVMLSETEIFNLKAALLMTALTQFTKTSCGKPLYSALSCFSEVNVCCCVYSGPVVRGQP